MRFWDKMYSVKFWTFVFGFLHIAEAGMIGDQCDWSGSGLTDNADRGVTPVYLRCREGSLSWKYPRGALRLLFRPPLSASEQDFRVCIRVLRRPDPPDLFHAEPTEEIVVAERFPARLFIERRERLVPLYAPDDEDPRELRCFNSRRGRAALYVEAEPEQGPHRRVASVVYEARPLARTRYDPATADCRPCSEAELELAFCTSDLVTRALVIDTQNREDLDTTQLTLKLTKLIRATSSEHELNKRPEDYNRYEVIENELEADTFGGRRRNVRSLVRHAHIHVPSVCGAVGGSGEFFIMARRRLGKLALVCAPRIEDWVRIVEARNSEGSAHCLLQH